MKYTILMRRAPLGPDSAWVVIGEVGSADEAADELRSWTGPRPDHGDLVRVVGRPSVRELHVFDSSSASWLSPPPAAPYESRGPWLGFWEGPMADAESMLRACVRVDRRRIVLAACDCAAMVTPLFLEQHRALANEAINAVRAWAADSFVVGRVKDALRRVAIIDSATEDRHHALLALRRTCEIPLSEDHAANGAGFVAHESAMSAASSRLDGPSGGSILRRMAPLVRARIPLSVALCASMKLRDPVPLRETRSNPRDDGRGWCRADLDVETTPEKGPDAYSVDVSVRGQAGAKEESHVYSSVGRGPRIASMLYDIGAEVVSEELDRDDGGVYGYINHVHVVSVDRRSGLGSAMVMAALERMGALGVKDVYLEAGPEEEDVGVPQLLRFYRKLGFRRDTSEPYGNLLRLRIGGGS